MIRSEPLAVFSTRLIGRKGQDCAAGPGRRRSSLRLVVSLPLLAAFGLFSSPARAMPAASMQLFRVDGNGVKPLPVVSALLEGGTTGSTPGAAGRAPIEAAAAPRTEDLPLTQTGGSAASLSVLRQRFVGPLPRNLSGAIRLVSVGDDGALGPVVEEIPFSGPNVIVSTDRTELAVRPTAPIAPGQSVMMQLPSRSLSGAPFVYPNHLASTPCVFKAPAMSSQPKPPAPTAGSTPYWLIVAGAVVVGVGLTAAFTGGGGGGATPISQ